MTDLLQIIVCLVWAAALHKTYLDGCRKAELVLIGYGWYQRREL